MTDFQDKSKIPSDKFCARCSGTGRIHPTETLAHDSEDCMWCEDCNECKGKGSLSAPKKSTQDNQQPVDPKARSDPTAPTTEITCAQSSLEDCQTGRATMEITPSSDEEHPIEDQTPHDPIVPTDNIHKLTIQTSSRSSIAEYLKTCEDDTKTSLQSESKEVSVTSWVDPLDLPILALLRSRTASMSQVSNPEIAKSGTGLPPRPASAASSLMSFGSEYGSEASLDTDRRQMSAKRSGFANMFRKRTTKKGWAWYKSCVEEQRAQCERIQCPKGVSTVRDLLGFPPQNSPILSIHTMIESTIKAGRLWSQAKPSQDSNDKSLSTRSMMKSPSVRLIVPKSYILDFPSEPIGASTELDLNGELKELDLMRALFHETPANVALVDAFLASFRAFMDPQRLLDWCFAFLRVSPAPRTPMSPTSSNTDPSIPETQENLSVKERKQREEQMQRWRQYISTASTNIRRNVIQFLLKWITKHWIDFIDDVNGVTSPDQPNLRIRVESLAEELIQGLESVAGDRADEGEFYAEGNLLQEAIRAQQLETASNSIARAKDSTVPIEYTLSSENAQIWQSSWYQRLDAVVRQLVKVHQRDNLLDRYDPNQLAVLLTVMEQDFAHAVPLEYWTISVIAARTSQPAQWTLRQGQMIMELDNNERSKKWNMILSPITQYYRWFEALIAWVGTMVALGLPPSNALVRSSQRSNSVKALKSFVKLAQACYRMNNFATSTAILVGLCRSPLFQYEACWNELDDKYFDVLREMFWLVDWTKTDDEWMSNYKLRVSNAKTTEAMAPFPGFMLLELYDGLKAFPPSIGESRLPENLFQLDILDGETTSIATIIQIHDILSKYEYLRKHPYVSIASRMRSNTISSPAHLQRGGSGPTFETTTTTTSAPPVSNKEWVRRLVHRRTPSSASIASQTPQSAGPSSPSSPTLARFTSDHSLATSMNQTNAHSPQPIVPWHLFEKIDNQDLRKIKDTVKSWMRCRRFPMDAQEELDSVLEAGSTVIRSDIALEIVLRYGVLKEKEHVNFIDQNPGKQKRTESNMRIPDTANSPSLQASNRKHG